MGQPEIVIASAQVAFDLLESRGNKINFCRPLEAM